ncbi:ClpX C4-type zinc finger protein [Nonomuraea fuscirosea]|uniref:ClpX C4-type zinc finger protein n=1 Tax=Nonomuraea fuscirosea TaxID=1291556 RepID=UPI003433BF2C
MSVAPSPTPACPAGPSSGYRDDGISWITSGISRRTAGQALPRRPPSTRRCSPADPTSVALAHEVLHQTQPGSISRTHIDPLPAESPLRCSFCHKPADPGKTLAAGPRVRICDECVRFCSEVLAARPE